MSSADKPSRAGGSQLRRSAQAVRRHDPDQTDPEAVLPADLAEEVDDGMVSEFDEDHTEVGEVGPGDKTQVYDPSKHAPADPDKREFKLVVLAGPKAGAEFQLDVDELTLGRGADNLISIPDVSVSRRHIRLARQGDTFRIEDLGSGNGTKVNDQKVQQAEVQHGDEIAVGDTVVQLVEVGVPAVKKKAKAPGKPSGETAAPTTSTRHDLGKVPAPQAKKPAAAAASEGIPASRRRLYVMVGAVAVLFVMLGLAKKAKDQKAADAAAAEAQEAASNVEQRVAEGKRLAKKHDWIAAVKEFESALEQGGDDADVQRYLDGAKGEAAFQQKLVEAKNALAQNDFVQAKSALDQVPVKADVYPDAQDLAKSIDGLMDKALADARSALSSGDRDRARDLVQKVLAANPGSKDAGALQTEIDKRTRQAGQPVPKKVVAAAAPAPAPAPVQASSGALAAYLAGDLLKAIKLAEDAGDPVAKNLHAFEAAYRDGMSKAEGKHVPEAVRSLAQASKIDRDIAHGKPSKPGREVNKQLANMEYLLGIDAKGDEQLPRAAGHFRAALEADPENELAKKMIDKTYARAKEIYIEAYVGKGTQPELSKKQFRLVMDTLPPGDETYEKAKRKYEDMGGGSK